MRLRPVLWQSFDEAEAALRPLLEGQANPFANFDWQRLHWSELNSARGGRLVIAGLYRDDVLVSAAILSLRRDWLRTRIYEFAAEGRSDRSGVFGEDCPELWSALNARGSAAVLRAKDVREDDALIKREFLRRTALYPSPWRDLEPGIQPESRSQREFQRRIPGYLKRLQALGEVKLEALESGALLEQFERLFQLHDRRHLNRRNAWKQAANRGFLRKYLEQAAQPNVLAFVLTLNGEPVAFDLGFAAAGVFTLYIPAFDPAYEKFRLGHILRWLSFSACRERGIMRYDFSRGDSFAKRIWSHGALLSYELVTPLTPGLRARISAEAAALPNRVLAFAREKGWSRRLGAALERLKPLTAVRQSS